MFPLQSDKRRVRSNHNVIFKIFGRNYVEAGGRMKTIVGFVSRHDKAKPQE